MKTKTKLTITATTKWIKEVNKNKRRKNKK